jgi:hypothetical protein
LLRAAWSLALAQPIHFCADFWCRCLNFFGGGELVIGSPEPPGFCAALVGPIAVLNAPDLCWSPDGVALTPRRSCPAKSYSRATAKPENEAIVAVTKIKYLIVGAPSIRRTAA